jgi:hypothetical protein
MESEDLEYYLEVGAVELTGIDENGEFMFRITKKAKEVAPLLWKAHQQNVDEMLMDLYEKGLLSVSYNEELEATFELTDEGISLAEEYGLFQFPGEED